MLHVSDLKLDVDDPRYLEGEVERRRDEGRTDGTDDENDNFICRPDRARRLHAPENRPSRRPG